MSGGDIEVMEDSFIKSESEKLGFDYTKIYSLDVKILKKYITV